MEQRKSNINISIVNEQQSVKPLQLLPSTSDFIGEHDVDGINDINEQENDPYQISFNKWLSQYNLAHFHDTFIKLGFNNVYVIYNLYIYTLIH